MSKYLAVVLVVVVAAVLVGSAQAQEEEDGDARTLGLISHLGHKAIAGIGHRIFGNSHGYFGGIGPGFGYGYGYVPYAPYPYVPDYGGHHGHGHHGPSGLHGPGYHPPSHGGYRPYPGSHNHYRDDIETRDIDFA